MKNIVTREAAVRRQPRANSQGHAKATTTPPAATEWAWPGFTRAELRAHIIDQIG